MPGKGNLRHSTSVLPALLHQDGASGIKDAYHAALETTRDLKLLWVAVKAASRADTGG